MRLSFKLRKIYIFHPTSHIDSFRNMHEPQIDLNRDNSKKWSWNKSLFLLEFKVYKSVFSSTLLDFLVPLVSQRARLSENEAVQRKGMLNSEVGDLYWGPRAYLHKPIFMPVDSVDSLSLLIPIRLSSISLTSDVLRIPHFTHSHRHTHIKPSISSPSSVSFSCCAYLFTMRVCTNLQMFLIPTCALLLKGSGYYNIHLIILLDLLPPQGRYPLNSFELISINHVSTVGKF